MNNVNENKNLATDLFDLGVDNVASVQRQADDATNPDAVSFLVSLKDGAQLVLSYSKKQHRRQPRGPLAQRGAKVLDVLGRTGHASLASLERVEREHRVAFVLTDVDGNSRCYVYSGDALVGES